MALKIIFQIIQNNRSEKLKTYIQCSKERNIKLNLILKFKNRSFQKKVSLPPSIIFINMESIFLD